MAPDPLPRARRVISRSYLVGTRRNGRVPFLASSFRRSFFNLNRSEISRSRGHQSAGMILELGASDLIARRVENGRRRSYPPKSKTTFIRSISLHLRVTHPRTFALDRSNRSALSSTRLVGEYARHEHAFLRKANYISARKDRWAPFKDEADPSLRSDHPSIRRRLFLRRAQTRRSKL